MIVSIRHCVAAEHEVAHLTGPLHLMDPTVAIKSDAKIALADRHEFRLGSPGKIRMLTRYARLSDGKQTWFAKNQLFVRRGGLTVHRWPGSGVSGMA